MQRLQKTFCVGGILGLCLSLAAPAQAQVIYVQSSNFRAVPVTQSFVQTRTIGSPRYSYGANYGSNYGYGYGSNYNYDYATATAPTPPTARLGTIELPVRQSGTKMFICLSRTTSMRVFPINRTWFLSR